MGYSTHDMEATIQFYEEILGLPRVADNLTRIEQGGTLRQVYFDTGGNQFLVFMEPKSVPGIADDYDTGINEALGVPGGMYHFALKVPTLEVLEARRRELESKGVEVSTIVDLDMAKSVFLFDPNGLQVELCCHTRSFDASDLGRESVASMALPE